MNTVINIPEDIKENLISFLQSERIKAVKKVEAFDKAIEDLTLDDLISKQVSSNGTFNNEEKPKEIFRGTIGWKFKVDDVIGINESDALPVIEIVDRICLKEPNLNRAVAKKSIGSALSQNSNSLITSKNKYLFIIKNGLKFYYKNLGYNL